MSCLTLILSLNLNRLIMAVVDRRVVVVEIVSGVQTFFLPNVGQMMFSHCR